MALFGILVAELKIREVREATAQFNTKTARALWDDLSGPADFVRGTRTGSQRVWAIAAGEPDMKRVFIEFPLIDPDLRARFCIHSPAIARAMGLPTSQQAEPLMEAMVAAIKNLRHTKRFLP